MLAADTREALHVRLAIARPSDRRNEGRRAEVLPWLRDERRWRQRRDCQENPEALYPDRRPSQVMSPHGSLWNVQRTVPECVITMLGIVTLGPSSTVSLPWRTSVSDCGVTVPDTNTR